MNDLTPPVPAGSGRLCPRRTAGVSRAASR